ncbi:hypothetical protein INF73_21955, partial [Enterobacter cloacae complex sp. P6RS]
LTASWVARDARGSLPFLFHPGDIFLAGRTEDIRLFFAAPLATCEIYSRVYAPGMTSAWRYVPEQWLWINAIKLRTGKMVYQGNFETSPALVESSEQFFLANFIPFSARRLGLSWPKYWRKYPLRGLFSLYTTGRWQELYASTYGLEFPGSRKRIMRFFIALWRFGYILREYLLRCTLLRRVAHYFFVHHE